MASNDTDVNVNIGATNSAGGVIQQAMGQFSNLWKSVGMGEVAGAMAVGGVAAVTAGIVVSIKQAAAFQQQLTQLVTGAGESESNLKMVGDGIKGIAISTGTNLKSLTDGMFMIESAGYHGQAGLDVLKVAAQGAKVGNADLGTAAQAVTTVMHDYGLKASDAGQAMNFLVSTVSNGKMHMDDLTGSMGKILPTASQLHIPLAQVGGAMSTMTDAGIPASRAATALQMTMLKLVTPGAAATKALKEVGLSSTDLGTTLTTKGLLPALQELTDHVGKKFPVGSAQYLAALSNITGGVRGLTGTLATTGINMQTFLGNTQKIAGATQDAGNKVIGWSLVQQDLSTKWSQFKELIQVAAVDIGQKLIPVIQSLLQTLFKIGSFLVGLFKPAIDSLVKAIRDDLMPVIDAHKKQIDALIKVIGILVAVPFAAMVAVVYVGIKVWTILIGVIGEAIKIFSGVVGIIGSVIGWIGNLAGSIIKAVSGFGGLLYNAGKDLVGGLIHGIEDVAGNVFKSVEGIGDKAVKALKGVLKIFSPSQVFADIGQNVGLGFIQGIQGTHAAVAEATGRLGQASIGGVAHGVANINSAGLSSPGSVSNTTANTTNSQSVTIQNLTIQPPNGATFQSIIASLNQDSLNASKGLTVNAGAI